MDTQGQACKGDSIASDSIASDHAEIIVVRHGETEWNADGKLQGQLDVDLNEIGRQEADALAERLSKEEAATPISAIYSSDLKRALQTGETIATLYGNHLKIVQDINLRERHLGELQGLTTCEAAKRKPEAYQAFTSRKRDQDIPGGGESLDQLYHRCTSALESIGAKHRGERVVVVTHGGVIRALHKRACPEKRLKKSESKILNASVNVFHLFGNGDWVIKTWGDVSHLDDIMYEGEFGGEENSA